eukprot:417453-Amphidinium_carterae.1
MHKVAEQALLVVFIDQKVDRDLLTPNKTTLAQWPTKLQLVYRHLKGLTCEMTHLHCWPFMPLPNASR